MIFTIGFFIIGSIINVISLIAGSWIKVIFPAQFILSAERFIAQLRIFSGIFPIGDLMFGFGILMDFLMFIGIFKLMMWLMKMIPFIGKYIHKPNEGTLTVSESESINPVGAITKGYRVSYSKKRVSI